MATTKEKANKVRLEILACDDTALYYFSEAVRVGDFKSKLEFESMAQFINRVAEAHVKNNPF